MTTIDRAASFIHQDSFGKKGVSFMRGLLGFGQILRIFISSSHLFERIVPIPMEYLVIVGLVL